MEAVPVGSGTKLEQTKSAPHVRTAPRHSCGLFLAPQEPAVCEVPAAGLLDPAHRKDPESKQAIPPKPHAACCLVSLPATLVSWNIPETWSPTLNETAVLTAYKEAGNPAMDFQPWKPHEKLGKQLSLPFPVFFIQASPKDGLARERRFAELFVVNPGFH